IGHGCSWITGPGLNGTEVSRVEFRVSHQLGRRIGTSLQQDRKERARRAREAIEAALADSDLQLGRGKGKAMVPGGSGRTCTALLPVDGGEADRGEMATICRPHPVDLENWRDPAADALNDHCTEAWGIRLLDLSGRSSNASWIHDSVLSSSIRLCMAGFVKGRGCGTAGIEAKLAQQLACLKQRPLYGIFIDLRKVYDAMDRDRCMEIVEGYGVGPNMMRLIQTFWDEQKLVCCRASKRYGEPFKASRGVTQGGPLSPKIFNIMVDAIVREWIRLLLYKGREEETEVTVSDSVAEPLNTLSILLALLLYADDAYIASTSRRVVQDSMDILTELFDRVGILGQTQRRRKSRPE
ncbi:hypothetical protein THAOC_00175, partial [Thalassiosira oceanica]